MTKCKMENAKLRKCQLEKRQMSDKKLKEEERSAKIFGLKNVFAYSKIFSTGTKLESI